MWRQSLIRALIRALLLLALGAGRAEAFEIEGMRLTARAGGARLVLDLEAPMRIRAASVWAPSHGRGYRLAIDLAPLCAGDTPGASFGSLAPEASRPVVPVPRLPPDLERPTVVIDPGHGGVDPGAIARSGVHEKTVVLAFAATLARASARGASLYTLSKRGSDGLASELAVQENKTDLIAGLEFEGDADVAGHPIDMQQRSAANRSVEFARLLLSELEARVPLLRRPRRSAAFRELKSPKVPSVPIELGFLSSPSDERRLRQPATREEVADTIETALAHYFAARGE